MGRHVYDGYHNGDQEDTDVSKVSVALGDLRCVCIGFGSSLKNRAQYRVWFFPEEQGPMRAQRARNEQRQH
jgi:hypothetical protein